MQSIRQSDDSGEKCLFENSPTKFAIQIEMANARMCDSVRKRRIRIADTAALSPCRLFARGAPLCPRRDLCQDASRAVSVRSDDRLPCSSISRTICANAVDATVR